MTQPAKHTPGPWVVNVEGRMVEAQLPNLRDEYEHICDLRGGIKGQINLANANLIAAAPAMYEALQHALGVCEGEAELRGDSDSDDYLGGAAGPVAQMIRHALAQAEGKQ